MAVGVAHQRLDLGDARATARAAAPAAGRARAGGSAAPASGRSEQAREAQRLRAAGERLAPGVRSGDRLHALEQARGHRRVAAPLQGTGDGQRPARRAPARNRAPSGRCAVPGAGRPSCSAQRPVQEGVAARFGRPRLLVEPAEDHQSACSRRASSGPQIRSRRWVADCRRVTRPAISPAKKPGYSSNTPSTVWSCVSRTSSNRPASTSSAIAGGGRGVLAGRGLRDGGEHGLVQCDRLQQVEAARQRLRPEAGEGLLQRLEHTVGGAPVLVEEAAARTWRAPVVLGGGLGVRQGAAQRGQSGGSAGPRRSADLERRPAARTSRRGRPKRHSGWASSASRSVRLESAAAASATSRAMTPARSARAAGRRNRRPRRPSGAVRRRRAPPAPGPASPARRWPRAPPAPRAAPPRWRAPPPGRRRPRSRRRRRAPERSAASLSLSRAGAPGVGRLGGPQRLRQETSRAASGRRGAESSTPSRASRSRAAAGPGWTGDGRDAPAPRTIARDGAPGALVKMPSSPGSTTAPRGRRAMACEQARRWRASSRSSPPPRSASRASRAPAARPRPAACGGGAARRPCRPARREGGPGLGGDGEEVAADGPVAAEIVGHQPVEVLNVLPWIESVSISRPRSPASAMASAGPAGTSSASPASSLSIARSTSAPRPG